MTKIARELQSIKTNKQTKKPRILELKNTYYIISNIADAFTVDWTLSTLENTSVQNKEVGKHRKQHEWLGMQLSW